MQTRNRYKVREGDTIEVLTGVDRGKRGQVLTVLPEKERVLVEGVNMRWKHQRRSREDQQGGRVQREASLHISNVAIVSEETGTAQRVRMETFQAKDKSGKLKTYRYRVGVKDGKPISAGDKDVAARRKG
ncbi:MAG: 50S ribosomal protein L24 [Planctomycetota bacterium]|jgi:large subunit ribosomal protein L24